MAQIVRLKRTSVSGKVPETSNIQLGELAMNTYDGRIFFEKNTGGTETIEEIVTTDSQNPITGSINLNGSITANSLTVDDITIDGSTISDSGDLTLDIGGDLNIDVDGTDIILKDGGTAFGRFKRDSSDFIIKSEANNEDIIFRGQDGGSTIDALTLDMSEAGAASFNSTISATGATFSNLSSATEATSVMINGSNQLVTRELGSNAFTSTSIPTQLSDLSDVKTVTVMGGLSYYIGSHLPSDASGGQGNLGVGNYALYDVTSGDFNTSIGHNAGANITSGVSNTLIGSRAAATLDSSYVTAIGADAIFDATSAADVIAIGYQAAADLTTGSQNILIGRDVAYSNNSGNVRLTTGTKNILIGNYANVQDANSTNQIVIGNYATGNGNNTVTIGNSDTTDNYFFGNIHGTIAADNGLISGSTQITNLTTHKETVSGASSYAVDHNLGEQYPIVQVWNTSTSQQVIPDSITTNSVNRVTVKLNHNFSGVIIVKK